MRMVPWVMLVTLSLATKTSAEDVPVGHMKPLGSHKAPSVIIDEFTVDNVLNPMDFFEQYVKPSKAALFRGAVRKSGAFNLWTDEYIEKTFGDLEVRLESKWEKHFLPPVGEKYMGRDNLRHFVKHYHEQDSMTYVVSDLPSPMYQDVGVLPSLGACGEMSRHFAEINIWWSGGGGRSILHKDAYNQMNCLLNGTKQWKLVENKYEKDIYKHPEPENEVGGFSDINPREVDLIQHPDVMKIEWSNFTVNAGDCLFLPKSYYHQVDSYGTHNLAISILFGRFDNRTSLDFSDCTEETDYKKLRRLSEFGVQWMWNGTGTMVMGNSDLEDEYRQLLLQFAEQCARDGKQPTFEVLKELMQQRLEEEMPSGDIHEGFRAVDKNGDGQLTVDEVKNLATYDLRAFAVNTERYEPSNNYNFEYSLISIGRVFNLLKRLLTRHEVLDRDTWIEGYKTLGGTELFGDEVFTRLKGEKDVVLKSLIKKADVVHALENWITYWAPQYSDTEIRPEELLKAKKKNPEKNAGDGLQQDPRSKQEL